MTTKHFCRTESKISNNAGHVCEPCHANLFLFLQDYDDDYCYFDYDDDADLFNDDFHDNDDHHRDICEVLSLM